MKQQKEIQSLDKIYRIEIQEEIERRQEGWRRELITAGISPNHQDELDWLRMLGMLRMQRNKDSTAYMSLEVEIDEHRTRSQRYNEEVTKLRRKWGTNSEASKLPNAGKKATAKLKT